MGNGPQQRHALPAEVCDDGRQVKQAPARRIVKVEVDFYLWSSRKGVERIKERGVLWCSSRVEKPPWRPPKA